MELSRIYFHSDALGHAVAKTLQYRRAGQIMRRYHLEFEVLRREAGSRVVTGGAFPDGCVSILHMQNAALPGTEKSLLLASVQGSLDFPIVAKQVRRPFDPCGEPARQGVLAATEMDKQSDEDLSFEASAAYWEAEKKGRDSPQKLKNTPKGAKKIKGDGHVLNGPNRRTGERNRCNSRGSGYHLAPKCAQRKQWEPASTINPLSANKPPRPPFSSTFMGNPVSVRMGGTRSSKEGSGNC